VTGAAGELSYTGGYMTKMKTRASDTFVWASNVAGGTGPQKGVVYAGATYSIAGTGYVKIDEVYSIDVFNTFYIEAGTPSRSTTGPRPCWARSTTPRNQWETRRSDHSRLGGTV
jgi:hypothetical protein